MLVGKIEKLGRHHQAVTAHLAPNRSDQMKRATAIMRVVHHQVHPLFIRRGNQTVLLEPDDVFLISLAIVVANTRFSGAHRNPANGPQQVHRLNGRNKAVALGNIFMGTFGAGSRRQGNDLIVAKGG
jgi:hypothetical protein